MRVRMALMIGAISCAATALASGLYSSGGLLSSALGAVPVGPMMSTCGPTPAGDCIQYTCINGMWEENGLKANGAACNDLNPCTTGDKCTAGECIGTGPTISDGNACTTDALDTATCAVSHTSLTNVCCGGGVPITTNTCCSAGLPKSNSTPCSDGNACTVADTCQAGVCVAGSPVVCTQLDLCHDVGICDTATGQCSNPARSCVAPDDCHLAGTCDPTTGVCTPAPLKAEGTQCGSPSSCGCSASGACLLSITRANYCYDAAGNMTLANTQVPGDACASFSCP